MVKDFKVGLYVYFIIKRISYWSLTLITCGGS